MPWCPNCKSEYREGITVCSDCKSQLVEEIIKEIEYVPFIQIENKVIAERLVEYFTYSGLKSLIHHDESIDVTIVSVPSDEQKKAQKYYKAFMIVEEDSVNTNQGSISDDEFDAPLIEDEQENEKETELVKKHSGPYVMKADKYKDLSSTVTLFLVFGILGIIFVVLNYFEIFTFINSTIQYIVFTALFLGFIYVAINTHSTAKRVKAEIDNENKLTDEINAWLKHHITQEYQNAAFDDTLSFEVNYINMIDQIRTQLLEHFGNQDTDYLDRLIEEYYDKTFEVNH